MAEDRPQRGGDRRGGRFAAQTLGGGEAPGEQADGGAFHIALAARHLPGEADARLRLQPQRAVQKARAVQEGVAVQAAQPRELRLLQAGDHAEDPRLLGVAQLGLEADEVVERAERVVLTKLDHRVGAAFRLVRVGQADRLHRAVAQRVHPALRHHLDGQAAFEVGRALLPLLEVDLLGGQQGVDEGAVFVLLEGAVDVVLAGAAGAGLVVARLEPRLGQVHALQIDDGSDGVEEGQRFLAGKATDCLGQWRRSEGAGGDDNAVPRLRGQAGDLAAFHGDERVSGDRLGHRASEAVAVHRQRAARRHLVRVGATQDQRTAAPHLLVQQPDRVVLRVVRPEGVGADQLGELVGAVRLGRADRPHLVQHDGNAALDELPRGFGPGEAAADDVNGGKGRVDHISNFHKVAEQVDRRCRHGKANPDHGTESRPGSPADSGDPGRSAERR